MAWTLAGGDAAAAGPTYDVQPVPGAASSGLFGISCPKVASCVAVGNAATSPYGALVETLAGRTWSPVTLDAQGLTYPTLNGVWCASVRSCVAVGEDGPIEPNGARPLVESLSDGTWTVTSPPLPKTAVTGALNAISCLTVDSCVAVGSFGDSTGDTHALYEVLGRGMWAPEVSATPTGSTSVSLDSVQCFTATSCDAVGYSGTSTTTDGLLETLSGKTWTATALGASLVKSISCVSSSSCLAVGYNSNGDISDTLTGTTWSGGTLPGMGDGGTSNGIVGVSCLRSITSCVAIGGWRPPSPNSSYPLLLIETEAHGLWTPTEIAAPSGYMYPQAIACPKISACVGIGLSDTLGHPAESAIEVPAS